MEVSGVHIPSHPDALPTLRIEKRHSSTEMSMEDLKHEIDSLNAQQQSVT